MPAASTTATTATTVSASSFGSSVKKGMTWTAVSTVLQAGLKLAVLALLARLLPPRDFGLIGLAYIFTNCAERIGQIGVGPALVQRQTLTPNEIRTGAILSVASGVLIALSLFCIAPFAAIFFRAEELTAVLQVLALGFIVDGFAITPDSLLQRELRFKELVLAENVAYIVGSAFVGLTLAARGWGVWALVLSNLSLRLVRAYLVIRAHGPLVHGRFERTAAQRLLYLGCGFSAGRILNFISLQGDNFIVGRLLGVEIVGMYTRAYQLMALPATYLNQILDRVLFPALAQQQGNPDTLRRVFLSTLEKVTLVALPVSVFVYLTAAEIIHVLFGPRWVDVVPVLRLLSLGIFFRTAYKCGDTVCRSLGKLRQFVTAQAVYACLVLGGSLYGSYVAGLQGVAVAVVGAVAVNYVVMTVLAARALALALPAILQAHVAGLIATMSSGALLLLVRNLCYSYDAPPLVTLISAAAAAAIGWGAVCLWMRLRTLEKGVIPCWLARKGTV
jgi:O-antigen/teichoic acid export membrane protein